MNKNKLFILITVIVAVILVVILAIVMIFFTRCQQQTPQDEKIGIEEDTELEEENEIVEEVSEEEPTEETTEEVSGEEPSEDEEVEGVAPTISLGIYEGPTYSSADGVCYYIIEAIVTGTPTPNIDYSRDDSGGAWGSTKCQINLDDPTETYTLTATATNTEGSATDSIELSWGCEEEENRAPEISEITIMGTKYINRTYGIGVNATDPDGDSLAYNWNVSGGTVDDIHAKNINWATPSECGNYTITVTVSDGKGGEDSMSEDIYVHFYYDLVEKAPSANWRNGSGDSPLWDVGLGDSRGFACYQTNIRLEDGNTYPKVLETHPEWVSGGFIEGLYSDVITIPEGARFKAKVGFIEGATATDGVTFAFHFYEGGIISIAVPPDPSHTYDGSLDNLDIDLSPLAGRSGQVIIFVYAHASSTQDWAVWVNPRIVN